MHIHQKHTSGDQWWVPQKQMNNPEYSEPIGLASPNEKFLNPDNTLRPTFNCGSLQSFY